MTRPFQRRTLGSLAVSIAIHVAIIIALVNIVWRYPLGQIMGIRQPEDLQQERLQYIQLPSQTTEHSGSRGDTASARAEAPAAPAALRAPVTVPAGTTPVVPSDTVVSRAAGGSGTGLGAGGAGPATGITPQLPDPRIALSTGTMARVPRTVAEDVDSIMDLAIGIYNDSMAMVAGQRKPGDWSVKGKDGKVWGWDKDGIRLGKFSIPNALLALLPLNTGGGGSPIEYRSLAYIRRDVQENAQRSVSEDEFRAAVKRIRQRKEREKREKAAIAEGAIP